MDSIGWTMQSIIYFKQPNSSRVKRTTICLLFLSVIITHNIDIGLYFNIYDTITIWNEQCHPQEELLPRRNHTPIWKRYLENNNGMHFEIEFMVIYKQTNLAKVCLCPIDNFRSLACLDKYSTGCPKKTPQNHWNNVLLKFECPSTKLNAKIRKILTRVHILNIDLLRNWNIFVKRTISYKMKYLQNEARKQKSVKEVTLQFSMIFH
jgi:hypothetical protein